MMMTKKDQEQNVLLECRVEIVAWICEPLSIAHAEGPLCDGLDVVFAV